MTFEILEGDVRDVLSRLPAASVHTVVTSPPYFGLRAYSTSPQVWGGDGSCNGDHEMKEDRPQRRMTGGTGAASAKQVTNQGSQFGNHEWGALVAGDPKGASGTSNGRNNRGEDYARGAPRGAFCVRCKAWRGELGSEPDVQLFIAHLVEVFREVKRVLHPSGTVWLNMGDSHAGSGKGPTGQNGLGDQGARQGFVGGSKGARMGSVHGESGHTSGVTPPPGYKPKDLMLIPHRLAIALQEDGWYVRMDNVWHKPGPMPESAEDRTTKAHEYVFLLSKSRRYYYDKWAIAEPSVTGDRRRPYTSQGAWELDGRPPEDRHGGEDRDTDAALRNKRSVWKITTAGFVGGGYVADVRDEKGRYLLVSDQCRQHRMYYQHDPWPQAQPRVPVVPGGCPCKVIDHFATFPEEIPTIAILAGTSSYGVCSECGAPWRRVMVRRFVPQKSVRDAAKLSKESRKVLDSQSGWGGTPRGTVDVMTLGWERTCKHATSETIPATVLDPFSGSGTTCLVADRLGRHGIGIELNPIYATMSRRRIRGGGNPLFAYTAARASIGRIASYAQEETSESA